MKKGDVGLMSKEAGKQAVGSQGSIGIMYQSYITAHMLILGTGVLL